MVDLHCHYPMHLLAQEPRDLALEGMTRVRRRRGGGQKLRAAVLALAARLLNFRRYEAAWRVDLDGLAQGDVRVVLSVLYQPFDEMDLDRSYGAPPEAGYHANLVDQLHAVEDELGRLDPDGAQHVVVCRAADLDAALAGSRVAILHCVEGGFALGATPDEVRAQVAGLGRLGVVYVTLAHLFWRGVATNEPALPFLPDPAYRVLFPQPRGAGLSELGAAAVEAMYEARMLVDLSHMRQDALDDTFALLDALDRRHGAAPGDRPVIASHVGCRVGRQRYNLSDETIRRIAARDGVVGLILAQHQLNDGIRRAKTTRLEESVEVICRHVDTIHRATGSYEHVAIGSDLDGFIKPTMGGLERAADLRALAAPLAARYGDAVAEQILSANALRVLRRVLA